MTTGRADRRHSERPVGRSLWLGALMLVTLIALVAWRGEARRFAHMVAHASPAWMLIGALLQLATYVAAAAVWALVLRRAHHPQPLHRLVPLGVAKLFSDQAVPSAGLSGSMLVVHALRRRGVPAGPAAAALLVSLVTYYLAYAAALGITLVRLATLRDLSHLLLALTAAFLALISTFVIGLLWLGASPHPQLPRWLRRVPGLDTVVTAVRESPRGLMRDSWLLTGSTLVQLAVFALDGGTLWAMLRGVGFQAPASRVFAAFVMASAAGTVGFVPGGLGTFDAACVGMLVLVGVPAPDALAATFLLRCFTFWLPMAPGVVFARQALD